MAGALNPLLGFAAGALTILSPCVLPLVPIVMGSAARASRQGPVVLAAGLVLSFTLTGFLLARLGAVWGLDAELVRAFGAVLLAVAGIVLLFQRVQDHLTILAAPLAGWAGARQDGLADHGLTGQFLIGALLGLVWSPCVGPTLGAATVLAAQGSDLLSAAITMAAFGLGIAAVLLVIAYATRAGLTGRSRRFLIAGKTGKLILGGLLLAMGLLILTGVDRVLEGIVLAHLPPALIDLSVIF